MYRICYNNIELSSFCNSLSRLLVATVLLSPHPIALYLKILIILYGSWLIVMYMMNGSLTGINQIVKCWFSTVCLNNYDFVIGTLASHWLWPHPSVIALHQNHNSTVVYFVL